jgi:hypothetical protein
VAGAARSEGIGLCGTRFFVSGEALTLTKAALIRASGAEVIPVYSSSEAGGIGLGCPRRTYVDEVHVLRPTIAVIQETAPGVREDPGRQLYLTSLWPTAPKVLLNTGLDDQGVLEYRHCSCRFGKLGLTECLHHIHSPRKLTAEGMTLGGMRVAQWIDEYFARHHRGEAVPYQIVEEEDTGGISHIQLRISPQLEGLDTGRFERALRSEIEKVSGVAFRLWSAARTLDIVRAEPLILESGKVPLVYRRRSQECVSRSRQPGRSGGKPRV